MDENRPPQPQIPSVDLNQQYSKSGNLEAHIIADMLRIEGITTELRELKLDTKARFDKLEGWIIAIVSITVTSLIATVGGLLLKVLT